jgi:hypothetical protein
MDRKAEILRLLDEMEREAYQLGKNEVIKKLEDILNRTNKALDEKIANLSLGLATAVVSPVAKQPKPRGRPPRAKGLVLKTVTETPGIRGAEIVKRLASTGNPISERTVRTSLRRLRKAREIRQENGGWYPAEGSEGADDEPSAQIRMRLQDGDTHAAA